MSLYTYVSCQLALLQNLDVLWIHVERIHAQQFVLVANFAIISHSTLYCSQTPRTDVFRGSLIGGTKWKGGKPG